MFQAVESAADTAIAAGTALKHAHGDLMNVHYAIICGEDVHTAVSSCTVEDDLETKRNEIYSQRWALPSDDTVVRTEAALTKASPSAGSATPTAAAAAFAAAQAAAKRRLKDDTNCHPAWHEDANEETDGSKKQKEALTKKWDGEENFDFSMFHQDMWKRAAQRAEAMLMQQQPGVFCYRESVPKPQSKVHGCVQVRCRVVKVNTEEKICRCYQAMAAGGGADRNGFLLGASSARFMTLAKEKSDGPEAKNGGDLGWVGKGKLDLRIEEVAFNTPVGACSPPFRVALASFHLVFVEDRR
jgi:hypothetical protein